MYALHIRMYIGSMGKEENHTTYTEERNNRIHGKD